MFLQIGDTFINQERIECVRIYVESDTREKLLDDMDRVKYCINSPFVSKVDVTYYKAVIVVNLNRSQQKWIISAYSNENLNTVHEKVELLRKKLFENLGIHNIKIDLETGEFTC